MPNFEKAEVKIHERKQSAPKPAPPQNVILGETLMPSKPHECIIHAVRGPENAAFWQELEGKENLPYILMPFVRRIVEPSEGWGAKVPVSMWGATMREWNEVIQFASQLEHWDHEYPQLVIRVLYPKN